VSNANNKDAAIFFDDLESNSLGCTYGVISFQVKPNSRTVPHSHLSSEMWIVLRGSGKVKVDNEELILIAGEPFFVESNILHSIINDTDKPLDILSLWWRS